jgi:hypothetical protein
MLLIVVLNLVCPVTGEAGRCAVVPTGRVKAPVPVETRVSAVTPEVPETVEAII